MTEDARALAPGVCLSLLRRHVATSRVSLRLCERGERGLHASCDLRAGDVVLSVARDGLVTRRRCVDSLRSLLRRGGGGSRGAAADEAAAADGAFARLGIDAVFCLWLMAMRRVGRWCGGGEGEEEEEDRLLGYHSNYVRSLPQESPCPLDFASDEELAVLQNPRRVARVEERRRFLRGLYAGEVRGFLAEYGGALERGSAGVAGGGVREEEEGGGGWCGPAAFLWAYGIVDSRGFSSSEEASGYALIPFADMFNHALDGVKEYGETGAGDGGGGGDGGGYVFKAFKAAKAGEEVHLCYNEWMGQFHWALHYGFVPVAFREYSGGGGGGGVDVRDLPAQRYELRLPHCEKRRISRRLGHTVRVSREARVAQAGRERLLAAYDCEVGGLWAGGIVDVRTIQGLRFLGMEAAFEGVARAAEGLPVSAANELCAYTALVRILRDELSRYDTTASDDVRVLGGGVGRRPQLPAAVELCLATRVLDKRLLTQALHGATTYQTQLADSAYTSGAAGQGERRLPPPPRLASKAATAPTPRRMGALFRHALSAVRAAGFDSGEVPACAEDGMPRSP